MSVKLPFGLRVADQRLVDVTVVENGARCGCVCPACKGDLIARNRGRWKIAHFAHGADCGAAYETAVHDAAKQIIRELGFVWLPASPAAPKTQFHFSAHTLEKKYDRVVPDVMIWKDEKRKLAVEVFVTHAVDEAKLSRLRSQRLACVEFDLSDLPRGITYDALRGMFATDAVRAKWIFNPRADHLERRKALEECQREREKAAREKVIMAALRTGAVKKEVYATKNGAGYTIYHVPNCPWRVRGDKGYTFANVTQDCMQCRFCFGIARKSWGDRRRADAPPYSVSCAGHMKESLELVGKGNWRMPFLNRRGLAAI